MIDMKKSAMMLVLALLGVASPSFAADGPAAARREPRVRIILVGDSTVTDTSGWGLGFKATLADEVECVNASLGGRSSKSFREEGHWDEVLKKGADYVLIQFGHNDQPGKGPERETDAGTEYRANLERYIREARAAGMKPVLVTPLTRRQFGNDGKIRSTFTPYVAAVKQVAAAMDVPLIDLHARSIALCESLGKEGCEAISPRTEKDVDATHLNARGSELMGRLVADELRKVVPELGPSFRSPRGRGRGQRASRGMIPIFRGRSEVAILESSRTSSRPLETQRPVRGYPWKAAEGQVFVQSTGEDSCARSIGG
jgi:lysophospholipase L1-like esterase